MIAQSPLILQPRFPVAASPPPSSSPSGPPVMTPGAYLRLRRVAAGLTVDQVALLLGRVEGSPVATRNAVAAYRNELLLLEQGSGAMTPERAQLLGRLQGMVVGRLHDVFAFDHQVYLDLVAIAADPEGELPRPRVCRACGCTWNHPCDHSSYGACAWVETADDEAPICSHCQLKGPANER